VDHHEALEAGCRDHAREGADDHDEHHEGANTPWADGDQPIHERASDRRAGRGERRAKRKKRKKKHASEFQQLKLTVEDGAKYMSMSVVRLRWLVQTGELRVVKVGEKTCPWLLDTVELNAWVEQEPATFGKKSR